MHANYCLSEKRNGHVSALATIRRACTLKEIAKKGYGKYEASTVKDNFSQGIEHEKK